MSGKDSKSRRQFLKNTSLAVVSASVLGNASASSVNTGEEKVDCNPTTLDLYGEGPFYTEDPPMLLDNILANESEAGERMIISGRVHNLDCSEYIPNTIIDIWHANDAGEYDNVGYNLRGQVLSNSQGFYVFDTIKPGKYLNGATFRPSHIHFKITPPGFPLLTTQLYFEGDTSIAGDAAASVTSGNFDASHRIIPLVDNKGILEGTWDIVVDGDGVNGIEDLHLSRGMIYSATPNPFQDRVVIQYGIFREANISLLVFNVEGILVATLEEQRMSPEKYEAVWIPNASLKAGHYFISLKVNDIQVHYTKIVKL